MKARSAGPRAAGLLHLSHWLVVINAASRADALQRQCATRPKRQRGREERSDECSLKALVFAGASA